MNTYHKGMIGSGVFLFLLTTSLHVAAAQPPLPDTSSPTDVPPQAQQVNLKLIRPSVALVVGIFGLMFCLTFFLLIYAKFCHAAAFEFFNGHEHHPGHLNHRRFSGIEKNVIESLPFFRFASLKGTREGLECAVCLSKFEDNDLLRLLPKCKHAFHIDCVDRWLESHSSCPLCRHKVDAEDVATFKYNASSHLMSRSASPSLRLEDSPTADLELFVERDHSGHNTPPPMFNFGGSFRMLERFLKNKKDNESLLSHAVAAAGIGGDEFLHKFKHRIIVSGVVFKSRWSDLNSSDLMSLSSEMLAMYSSRRFEGLGSNGELIAVSPGPEQLRTPASKESVSEIKEETEKKKLLERKATQVSKDPSSSIPSTASIIGRSRSLAASSTGNNRSMSEITNMSRFADVMGRINRVVMDSSPDERVRQLWQSMARRTVQWFAGGERINQEDESKKGQNNV